jgi:hypothetical protein
MILEKLKANQAIEAYPDGWTCITCGCYGTNAIMKI